MSIVNNEKLLNAFGKTEMTPNSSLEDNDVNININAETETQPAVNPVEPIEPTPVDDTPVTPIPPEETGEDLDNNQDGLGDLDNGVGGEGDDESEDNLDENLDDELADADDNLDDAVEELDEADDAVEALESIYYTLANVAAENRPVDPSFMKMTHTAVAIAVSKFNLTPTDCGVASVESTEIVDVVSSMEGVGDTIKAGVSQIGTLLDNVMKFFADFLKSIFTEVGRAKKRLANVKTARGKNNGKIDAKVTVPAQLNGHIDYAFWRNSIKFLNAFVGEKYADLTKALENGSVYDGEKAILFNVIDRLYDFQNKEVLPNTKFTLDAQRMLDVTKTEGKSEEVTLNSSKVDDCIAIAEDLIETVEKYENGKSVRDAAMKKLRTRVKELESASGNNALETLGAARKISKFWSGIMRIEARMMSQTITSANALITIANKALPSAEGSTSLPAKA